MNPKSPLYHRHCFPPEIISYCIWLYNSFSLSDRDVEKMMLYRGVCVTYEAIRYWCRKFSQTFANEIRRRRPTPGRKWHLDEVRVEIKGEVFWWWRAVDEDGNVLDILIAFCRQTHYTFTVESLVARQLSGRNQVTVI